MHLGPDQAHSARPLTLAALALLAAGCDQHIVPSGTQASGMRGAESLTLEVDPLTLDFPATLAAAGAEPGAEVTFVRGGSLGSGPCPAVLGGLCVDLSSAAIVGRAVADADGVARLSFEIPGGIGVRDLALQALVVDGLDSATSAASLHTTVTCTHVPAQHPTLQAAIDAASDGDHICAAAGTYAERLDFGGRSLVVLGEDAATTVLDGGGPNPADLAPVLDVSGTDAATRVSRFTVTGGHTGEGAGVRADSSFALLTDLVVTGNTCDVPFASSPQCKGTGIYAWAGHIELRDVAVRDNHCDLTTTFGYACDGTGMYAELGAPELVRVEVSGNTQSADQIAGAGLYLLETDAVLDTVVVSANAQSSAASSHLEGAGVWIGGDGDVTIDGGAIRDNTQTCTSPTSLSCYAGGTGLLVDEAGGSVSLTGVTISDNVALTDSVLGAGLHASWSTSVDLSDVELRGNIADGADTVLGTGVFLQHTTLTADRTIIAGNSGTQTGTTGTSSERLEGIGLHADEDSVVTLTNTVIADNHGLATGGITTCSGGGVYMDGDLLLTNGIVAGNSCDHSGGGANGGGLYLDLFDADVELHHVDIVGNTAAGGLGEGLYASDGTTLVVSHTSISDPVHAWIFSSTLLDAEYSNFWGPVSGWTNPAGADGNLAVDPEYVDLSATDPVDWDLHLDPSSVLVDAGDPALSDVDSSRADIGAYGGPGADLPL